MTIEVWATHIGWDDSVNKLVDQIDSSYDMYEWGVLEQEWRWIVASELKAHSLAKKLSRIHNMDVTIFSEVYES